MQEVLTQATRYINDLQEQMDIPDEGDQQQQQQHALADGEGDGKPQQPSLMPIVSSSEDSGKDQEQQHVNDVLHSQSLAGGSGKSSLSTLAAS